MKKYAVIIGENNSAMFDAVVVELKKAGFHSIMSGNKKWPIISINERRHREVGAISDCYSNRLGNMTILFPSDVIGKAHTLDGAVNQTHLNPPKGYRLVTNEESYGRTGEITETLTGKIMYCVVNGRWIFSDNWMRSAYTCGSGSLAIEEGIPLPIIPKGFRLLSDQELEGHEELIPDAYLGKIKSYEYSDNYHDSYNWYDSQFFHATLVKTGKMIQVIKEGLTIEDIVPKMTELTMDDIAKKLNIPVSQLKIKKG
jgi:hypothetical protein